jgi:hypothetical protein
VGVVFPPHAGATSTNNRDNVKNTSRIKIILV